MTNKLVTWTALAALSLGSTAVLAQSPSPSPATPPSATPPATTDTSPAPAPAEKMPDTQLPTQGSAVPATPKFVSEQTTGQLLNSKLVGTDVVTSTDEKLGSISDIVLEKDGRAVAAVIDVGGFLGIGAKPVAVSFDSLTLAPAESGPKIVVALTKEELNQAPEFKTLEQVQSAAASEAPARTQ